MPRVLLIDPERILQRALSVVPALANVELEAAAGEADALSRLRRRSYDVHSEHGNEVLMIKHSR